MTSKKDTRSCPNCRQTVPRLLEHIRFCAANKTAEEHNHMNIAEVERGKFVVKQSVELMYLKAEYPNCYWEVASCLMNLRIPVYEKTDQKTTLRGRTQIVRHLTHDDIPTCGTGRELFLGISSYNLATKKPMHSEKGSTTAVSANHSMNEDDVIKDKTSYTEKALNSPSITAVRHDMDANSTDSPHSEQATGHISNCSDKEIASDRNSSAGGDYNRNTYNDLNRYAKVNEVVNLTNQLLEEEHPSLQKTTKKTPDLLSTSAGPIHAKPAENTPKRKLRYSASPVETPRLAFRKRIRRVILSDEESGETPTTAGHSTRTPNSDVKLKTKTPRTKTMEKRQQITKGYKELNMFLTSSEQKHYRKSNKYASQVEVKLATRKLYRPHHEGSKNPVKAYMSIVLKIMKFLASNNKVENFRWSCLCDVNKIETMLYHLHKTVGLEHASILKYHKALSIMFAAADDDVQFKLNEPERAAHLTIAKSTIKDQQRVTNKNVTQHKAEIKVKEAYVDIGDYEKKYVSIFEMFSRVQKDVVAIIKKADKEKNYVLQAQELFLVNSFFELYSMMTGNRPGVFQLMDVEIFDLADKSKQTREDGSVYYFLATSNHKTSTSYIAYIYMEEEYWDLLRIYRNHIRPEPEEGHQKYLFLNSKGKVIHNPSSDLGRLFRRYDMEELSSNKYRHLIETLSTKHMTAGERSIIHKMLSHSAATAEKHYVRGNSALVPHRVGIPLLEKMLQTCASEQKKTVSSFLCRADALLKGVSNEDMHKLEYAISPGKSDEDRINQSDRPHQRTLSLSQIDNGSIKTTDREPQRATSSIDCSTSSATSMDSSPKENEKWKVLEQYMEPLTAYSETNNDEYKQIAKRHPELRLGTDIVSVRKYNDWCRHKIQKLRTDEVVNHFRRAHNDHELEERIDRYLEKKKWKTKKLCKYCIPKVREALKRKGYECRRTDVSENINSQNDLSEQIQQQEWPNLKILSAGRKGLGVFASKDITENTFLCDYHGQLVYDEEGWERYNNLYHGREDNSYMFQFSVGDKKMWIDAVNSCECHPGIKLKGRLLNHDRKNPNAYPKVQVVGGRPHILLYSRRNIKKGDEIVFDYGTHADKHSDRMLWS